VSRNASPSRNLAGWSFGGGKSPILALACGPAPDLDGQDSMPLIHGWALAKPPLDGANLCTYRTILIFDSAKLLYWDY
jgi:hypothetical protein